MQEIIQQMLPQLPLDYGAISLRDCLKLIPVTTAQEDKNVVAALFLDKWEKQNADTTIETVQDLLQEPDLVKRIVGRLNSELFTGPWSMAKHRDEDTLSDRISGYIEENDGDIANNIATLLRVKAAFETVWEEKRTMQAAAPPQNDNGGIFLRFGEYPDQIAPRYRHYLETVREWMRNALNGEVGRVFQDLPDPNQGNDFAGRFLCVGQVQSGKTAHFSGIAAAAAGQGYKLIIVLTGRTRSLRNQTQHRLNREHLQQQDNQQHPYWVGMTDETQREEAADQGEFQGVPGNTNPFRHLLAPQSPVGLMVIKKNCAVLSRVRSCLKDFTDDQLCNIPLLIIDDEADEASLNGYKLPTTPNNPGMDHLEEIITGLQQAILDADIGLEQEQGDEDDNAYLYRMVTNKVDGANAALDAKLDQDGVDQEEIERTIQTLLEQQYLGAQYLLGLLPDGDERRIRLEEIVGEIRTNSMLRTGTNRRILGIANRFPKHCYLGYTATPAANILVSCENEGDLFPRHKIFLLNPGNEYRGLNYFYPSPDSDNGQADNQFLIRIVPDTERRHYRRQGWNIMPPPQCLRDSVIYFFLASAVYKIRNNQPRDTTMLVHVSAGIVEHAGLQGLVTTCVNNFIQDPHAAGGAQRIWAQVLNADGAVAERQRINMVLPAFEEAIQVAQQLARRLIDQNAITIENSTVNTEDRVEYPEEGNHPENAGCHIVIGGNVLARGLTLKRLLASYFIRRTGTQSGLLQMARWFGYWRGYEDLVRVWMPRDTSDHFDAIAMKVRDLSEQIRSMPPEIGAPINQALWMMHRRGIKPTSSHLMQHARQVNDAGGLPVGGSIISSLKLYHRNEGHLQANRAAANALLQAVVANNANGIIQPSNESRRLILNVNNQQIRAFFNAFVFAPQEDETQKNSILTIVQQHATWNLGIIGAQEGDSYDWGGDLALGKVKRVRINDGKALNANHIAELENLPRNDDAWFDLRQYEHIDYALIQARVEAANIRQKRNIPPLLALYCLDEKHKAPNQTRLSADWNGTSPCIAWAISLPSQTRVGGVVWGNSTIMNAED